MGCSPPGSSVRGILQARILEWVATPFSMRSSPPRDQTQVSSFASRCFTVWASREVPKGNQPWIFFGRTDAKAPILWPPGATRYKWSWSWERLRAGGEGDNREWDGWMASPTQWTWVWASSPRQVRTGKPGVLQSMGLQRVKHSLVTEQQQTSWVTLGN